MRALTSIAVLSSILTTAFSAPAPQATSAPTLACDIAGYTKTTSAYYFDTSGTKNNFASCSAACRAETKCKSFGFGESNCMLFDVSAGDNTNLNPMSPYTFYDVGCTEPGAPISSSSVKPPSSTPKPPSSTPKPPTTTPQPPTTTPKRTTSSTTPKSSVKPTSAPPSKTIPTPTPPTKTTTGEEVGPSSTRCPVPLYYQCGGYHDGKPWTGCTKCVSGAKCIWQNDWYYQCVAEDYEPPSASA